MLRSSDQANRDVSFRASLIARSARRIEFEVAASTSIRRSTRTHALISNKLKYKTKIDVAVNSGVRVAWPFARLHYRGASAAFSPRSPIHSHPRVSARPPINTSCRYSSLVSVNTPCFFFSCVAAQVAIALRQLQHALSRGCGSAVLRHHVRLVASRANNKLLPSAPFNCSLPSIH